MVLNARVEHCCFQVKQCTAIVQDLFSNYFGCRCVFKLNEKNVKCQSPYISQKCDIFATSCNCDMANATFPESKIFVACVASLRSLQLYLRYAYFFISFSFFLWHLPFKFLQQSSILATSVYKDNSFTVISFTDQLCITVT